VVGLALAASLAPRWSVRLRMALAHPFAAALLGAQCFAGNCAGLAAR